MHYLTLLYFQQHLKIILARAALARALYHDYILVRVVKDYFRRISRLKCLVGILSSKFLILDLVFQHLNSPLKLL